MKIVRIEKDLFVDSEGPYKRKLRAGEQYMFSDARLQRLSIMFPDYIGTVTDISAYYKPYKGENLDGKTLLVWRHGGIGDLLFMTPPLRLLKSKYPTCKLGAITGTEFVTIFQELPYLDILMPFPINARHLMSADYHLQFEGIIERNTDAKHINAYDLFLDAFSFDHTKIPDHEKRPDIFLNDVENRFADSFFADGNIKPDETKIGIQIQASSPIRTYPVERMATLARELVNRGAFVVLFGGPRQQEIGNGIVQSVCELTQTKGRIIATSTIPFSLRQSIAIARHMNAIVAPDSAMVHIGAGLGVPIVGIYGPFPSHLRMQYYYDSIGLNAATGCSPCFTHGHEPCTKGNPSPCFSTIEMPTVLNALDYVLKKTGQQPLSNMELAHHTEIGKVIEHCHEYMEGVGVDFGSGFASYPKEKEIARVDWDPLCDPDICTDFTKLVPEEKANYAISSFAVQDVVQLLQLTNVVNKTIVPEGYFILYVGDYNMVSKIETQAGRMRSLKTFFASKLTPEQVIESVSSRGLELIKVFHEPEKWIDSLITIEKPELLNYGFLSIWQKQSSTNK